jgi:hypothetical protein
MVSALDTPPVSYYGIPGQGHGSCYAPGAFHDGYLINNPLPSLSLCCIVVMGYIYTPITTTDYNRRIRHDVVIGVLCCDVCCDCVATYRPR